MKDINPCSKKAFPALAGLALLTLTANAQLLVYEGFQYGNPEDSLHGQPDGSGSDTDAVGLDGTWTDQTSQSASDFRMVEGSMAFGDLPTEGNHVAPVDRFNNDVMSRNITADLDENGELWFSILAEKVANNFSNGQGGLVIGNQAVNNSQIRVDDGSTGLVGFGLAPTGNGNDWTPYAWDGTSQTAGDASLPVGVGSGDIRLLVGHISFNTGIGGADEYTLYDFELDENSSLENGTLEQIADTIEIDIDETQLDTLSLTRHVETSYDEIRVAPSYDALFGAIFADDDSDGLPNWWENEFFGSNTAADPNEDLPDGDGLTNLEEFELGSDPTKADTDGDGLNDVVETNTGVWVSSADTGTDPTLPDTDEDGLFDGVESNTGSFVSTSDTGTSPVDPDTDSDGLLDGVESNSGTLVDADNTGTNPLLADTDADGATDWYEVVASFTDPSDRNDAPVTPYPLPDPDPLDEGSGDQPVKVYIMSGQSNMVGYGRLTGNEPGTLETLTAANRFPNLVDADGNWTARNDVLYRGVISDIGSGPLAPDVAGDSYGPELGFGYLMGWYHDEPVLIIKSSIGNRSLGWDCLPPGSSQYQVDATTYAGYGDNPASWETGTTPVLGGWYGGKSYDTFFLDEADMGPNLVWNSGDTYPKNCYIRHEGVGYRATTAHTADSASEPGVGESWTSFWELRTETNVTDILDNFATEYPDWASRGFEIAGFVWWQGHKDGGESGSGSAGVYASRYEQNLVRLINELRDYYENRYPANVVPDAPFVVASVGFGAGDWDPGSSADTIFNAQMAVGDDSAYPEFADTVASFDSTGYWRDFGPSDQSFHYNHNAETYLLVGDAAGRSMIELLSTDASQSFSDWIAGFDVGGQNGMDDDPDGDGVDNGVEALFGTAPDAANPGLANVQAGSGSFTFTHPLAGNVISNVSLDYEWSTDLSSWFTSGDSHVDTTVTMDMASDTPEAGIATVTVNASGTIPDKVFVRAVATQP